MGQNSSFLDPLLSPTHQDDGTPLPRRANINYVGFSVADNPTTDATDITNTGGSGAVAVADIPALRAISSLTDKEVATVANPVGQWVYSASQGAGQADDGLTIVKPNSILVGANGRWYNVNTSAVLPTIAALRLAVSGTQATVHVQNYSTVQDGGGGIFDYDSNDTTTADNTGIVVVAGTRRYKRRQPGHEYHPEWFGFRGDLNVLASLAIVSTQNTFTKSGLTSADIGKKLVFEGAGVAGAQLVTHITNVSGSTITLADAASTTVASGGHAFYYTDDQPTIQAAIDAIAAARFSQASSYDGNGLSVLVQPTLRFGSKPAGLASSLVSPGNVRYIGSDTVLFAPLGVDILSGFHYGDRAQFISFFGGSYGIKVITGNTDTTTLRIDNCNFFGQSVAGFGDDGASQSTHLWSYGCKFWSLYTTSKCVYQQTGDGWHISHAWFTSANDQSFVCGAPSSTENPRMYLDSILTVPATTTGTWVRWNAGSVVIENIRFGGESGGAGYLVDCHASAQSSFPVIPRALVMRNCALFSNLKLLRFFALPNLVMVDSCTGMTGSPTTGIYLDSSIPDADRRNFATYGNFVIDGVMQPLAQFDSVSDQAAAHVVLANQHHYRQSSSVNLADRILSLIANYSGSGLNSTASHCTNAGGTDSFGNSAIDFTTTLAGATQIWFWSTALTNQITVPSGLYTARFMIKATDNPVKVRLIAGDVNRYVEVPGSGSGFTPFYVTFYYDTGRSSDTGLGYQFFDLPNSTHFSIGQVTLYKGAVTGPDQEWETFLGSATPSHANEKPFRKGDVLVNSSPTTGNAFAWRVTTAGTQTSGAEVWEPLKNIDPTIAWPSTVFGMTKASHIEIGDDGSLPTAGTIRIARITDINAALIASRNNAATQDMRWFFADTGDFQYVFDFQHTGGSVINSSADVYVQIGAGQTTVLRYDSTNGQWLFPSASGATHPSFGFISYPNTGIALIAANDCALVAVNTKVFEWADVSGTKKLAFFSGSLQSKQTVTGALTDLTASGALKNLLTALAAYGLIVDSST